MIKVSIIITVYNVERYIDRCVRSILSQTYTNFELLIVNDGTADKSIEIAKRLIRDDTRARIIDYGNNVGLMNARRRGYIEAKGEYVVFVDSDDSIPTDAIEKLVKEADKSNADIVAGQGVHYLNNGESKNISVSLPYGDDSLGLYKALTHYKFTHYMWGKLYKSELLQNYEYKYFEKLTNAEDYCFMYQLAENVKKVACIDSIVYNYYQNLESSSQVKLNSWQLECDIMAYSFVLHILSKNPLLKRDIFASTQRAIARFHAKGYNKEGLLSLLMNKYDMNDLLSLKNLIKYNSIKDTLICIIGKSRVGSWIYKQTH